MITEMNGAPHSRLAPDRKAVVRQIRRGLDSIESEIARRRQPTREIEALLTINEVAEKLALKPTGVAALVKRRVIPALKISRRCLRFRWSEVEAAINRYRQPEIK